MSQEKAPLVPGSQPSAPPPAYQPPTQPQHPPPGYSSGPYNPPPQGGGYQPAPAGYQQQSNTTVYIQPTQQSRTVVVDIKPPNYVVLSVITMIFFCWIFGLIALLVGLQVDSLWLSGSRDEARRRSVQARMWNIVGMIVGVVVYVFTVIIVVSVNVASASYNPYN